MDLPPLLVARLGTVDYLRAWQLQRELAPLVSTRELPDVLLLLDHPHTYTIGRAGTREHLLVDDATLARLGAVAYDVDRGGDITYHGPGQLVGYPLLRVERFDRDIHGYLRRLEAALIAALGELGIVAGRVPGYTGVWVRVPSGCEKVAAIGVKLARHVTQHGFALNVATDPAYWANIIPCGIRDRGVTSIDRLLALRGNPVPPLEAVADLVLAHVAREFRLRPIEVAVEFMQPTAEHSGIRLVAPAVLAPTG